MPALSLPSWITALFKPNRRLYDRHAVHYGVRLSVQGTAHDCRMRDVSPSGALLVDVPALPVGTPVMLEIPQIALAAEARVVRHVDAGIGIAFSKDGVGAIIAGWARGQSGASE
ncbi:PilZ domain-containing protein [Niveispirillum fermenti]|uniref:PilZ domain-containing protein n=1 Tax=Niveispirillum fermenti TaxID=1233113 RepID=UPI003A8C7322